MNEREQKALDALLTSKKYGCLCTETVERAFQQAFARHKNLKDADKAARAHLHGIAGAYGTEKELSAARGLAALYQNGDKGALNRALMLHASTRERLSKIDELYDTVFQETGEPGLILDLACGLNPLYLGARGLSVFGIDIHGGAVEVVNTWASALSWPVRAEVKDALSFSDYPAADLALMMKLLPVLEHEKRGAAKALLLSVPARWKLITFPTRTLGGRRVGMEKQYSESFEALAEETGHEIALRFIMADELCYLARKEVE